MLLLLARLSLHYIASATKQLPVHSSFAFSDMAFLCSYFKNGISFIFGADFDMPVLIPPKGLHCLPRGFISNLKIHRNTKPTNICYYKYTVESHKVLVGFCHGPVCG